MGRSMPVWQKRRGAGYPFATTVGTPLGTGGGTALPLCFCGDHCSVPIVPLHHREDRYARWVVDPSSHRRTPRIVSPVENVLCSSRVGTSMQSEKIQRTQQVAGVLTVPTGGGAAGGTAGFEWLAGLGLAPCSPRPEQGSSPAKPPMINAGGLVRFTAGAGFVSRSRWQEIVFRAAAVHDPIEVARAGRTGLPHFRHLAGSAEVLPCRR